MKIINSPVRNIAPKSFGFESESRFPVVYARKSKAKAQAKKATSGAAAPRSARGSSGRYARSLGLSVRFFPFSEATPCRRK